MSLFFIRWENTLTKVFSPTYKLNENMEHFNGVCRQDNVAVIYKGKLNVKSL